MEPILIFDLADTLIEGFDSFVAGLSKRLYMATIDVIPGLGGAPLVALTEGRLSEAQYWQQVLTKTAWPLSAETLGMLLRQAFRQPVRGMPDLFAALHAHRRVLLADQAREWMAYIEATHPFVQQFDRLFLSYEMGQTKRQVATFQRVIAELGCMPQDCIFIDDLQWNVERAHMVGMRATRFTSTAALKPFFIQEGIWPPNLGAS